MWSDTELSKYDLKYATACLAAAKELGIEAVSPFWLEKNGERFVYAIHFPNFGGGNLLSGLVARVDGEIFDPKQCGAIWDVAADLGFCVWNQAHGAVETDAEELAGWLNHFNWCGPPGKRPSWHTAEHYNVIWPEQGSA